MKKRRRNKLDWDSREFKVIGSVGTVFLDVSSSDPIEIEDICRLADVTVEEAWMAIMDFARTGTKIRVKNELPLKFYWE